MVIDIVVGLLIAAFATWSYFRGLLRKLAFIAALVVASLGAGFAGRWMARFAAERWDIGAMTLLYLVCTILGWVVVFVASWAVFRLLARWLGSDETGRPAGWNKMLGGLVGTAEAAILCWFPLAMVDAVPEDTRARHMAWLHGQMENSWFMLAVDHTNPAARLELQPLIEDVSAIAARPAVLRDLKDEPVVRRLRQHEKVEAILADEALVQEFRDGHFRRFFSDRRVRDALEDRELREMLRQADVRDTLRRFAAKAREEGDA
ncbi:MAG: CvpA family protein [bacterium]